MNTKYIEKLEFNKIIEILANSCLTYIGKDLANNLTPQNNKALVVLILRETSEAVTLLYKKNFPNIIPIVDITHIIKTLESNSILSAKALLDVSKILKLSSALKNYFYEDNETPIDSFPILEQHFSGLYTNLSVQEVIEKSIIDEFTISDNASTILSAIRRKQRKLEETIKDKLNAFIHSSNYSKYIQENLITIRNDRYVIPVKEEYRTMINGFIHDFSKAGSTVFIEPMSIFELNNDIATLKSEEAKEIEKILANLTGLLYPIIEEIKNTSELIGKLDFIFAKASYAIKTKAIEPEINDKKFINLINARHPLINESLVVPININIGINFSSLVITGPNTGGKTVSLKTVGLLTLMACSGLHIPADEHSSIYVFDNVYADIGDEQSIKDSLSTFSSHMCNIIEMLNTSTSESLILLDELCTGTDPIEGSSLAISILESFYNKGLLTIATTHYPEIKNYALVTNGFENASSEFDLVNLKPTYKLLLGIPGKSNAFEISKKLGLDAKIIERANSFITSDNISIEELLKNIYDNKLIIEKEKEEIDKNLSQIELLRKSLENKNGDLKQKETSIIENAKIEARKILLDAKAQVSDAIKEINNIYDNVNSTSIKDLNNIRNNINSSIKETVSISSNVEDQRSDSLDKDEVFTGMNVYITNLRQYGTVLSSVNKSNQVQVQVGSAKMMIDLSNLVKSNIASTKSSKLTSTSSYKTNKAKTAVTEINVIGFNVEDAIFTIDKYLDDCYLAKLNTVRIVHGKGTGTLRKGIHQFLKTNSHVKGFRLGTFGEGEMGVTVVELK